MDKPKRILIVDDEKLNRELLQDLVVSFGHKPEMAEDGVEAIAKLKLDIDLVLLDVMMPRMDGFEVLKHMKADSSMRHIPVIMISALDEMKSVVRCIEKGADEYLTKPFNSKLLKARIVACLEKKHLRDREQQLHAELLESYEALQNAEQARDALFHMIVHDLKNPLTGMLGFAELLLIKANQDNLDKETLTEGLQPIFSSAKEMSSLINSILDISRLEADEMPVSLTAVNGLQLIKDLCGQFGPQAEGMGVHLSFEPESDAIMTRADKQLLSRTLQNLLTNAFKHTATGTNVTVSVKRHDSNVVFCVADNGPGIPEEYRDKIFGKFFQIEADTKGKKYGVGLGLAFCKMAAEAQGGSIWVESQRGKGATFKVSLEAIEA